MDKQCTRTHTRTPAHRAHIIKCGGFPADHEVELNAAPTEDKGPLQIRDEKWCRHENYTSEFMLEADIPLDKCKKLIVRAICETVSRVKRQNGKSEWGTGYSVRLRRWHGKTILAEVARVAGKMARRR